MCKPGMEMMVQELITETGVLLYPIQILIKGAKIGKTPGMDFFT